MLKVSSAVESHIRSSEIVFESLRGGLLNYSAFAKAIHKKIENDCMKPVSLGTIVVALSRLQKKIAKEGSVKPAVAIEDLSVKSPLCDISFEKTNETLTASRSLQRQLASTSHDFFTMTEGIHEITIVCSQKYKGDVLAAMHTSPKAIFEHVTGISLQFNEALLSIPNTMYAMMGELAPLHINVLEIVSTYTELTFIVNQQDARVCLSVFTRLMK